MALRFESRLRAKNDMASASTQTDLIRHLNAPEQTDGLPPGRQLPSGHEGTAPGIGEILRSYSALAGQALDVARVSALRTYYAARNGAIRNYSCAARSARETATRTRIQASDLKREHPVRLLAIFAGAAFVAGAASRIWRSRSL